MTARSDAIDIGFALDAAVRDRDKVWDVAEALARALFRVCDELDFLADEVGRTNPFEARENDAVAALDRWTAESGQEWRDWS